jgi:hypothetical protein
VRKNAQKNQLDVSKELQNIQEEYAHIFSEEFLDQLAREHGFIKRKRIVTATSFVNSLVFNQEDHKQFSLLDFKCDFFEATGQHISREGLHKQFTAEAVNFLKDIFSRMISAYLDRQRKTILNSCFFNGVYIKDSTKFNLPSSYFATYPSCGGYSKESAMMNIQYEFDILSGSLKQLELTKATRNDQTESKETLDQISPGSLNIRDLGYITTSYLKAVEGNNAYYLNRLPKIGVYQLINEKFKQFNWKALGKRMKKEKFEYLELDVYLGKSEKLKTRMVIVPVPKNVAEERICKAKKGGQRTNGYQISQEYKFKAHYNIMITNVPKEVLSALEVIEAYKLRWQVELVFKTWKSNLAIDQVKRMKKERMECQLIAKFIWILLNTKLFQAANTILKKLHPDKGCSLPKFFKRAKKFSSTLRHKINNLQTFLDWFDKSLIPIIPDLFVEQKGKKKTHYQSRYELFHT